MRLSPDCAFCRSYGVRVPLRWSHPIDLLTPHGTSKNQFADNRKAPILDRKPLHSDDSNHESIANHQRLSHSSPQRFPRSDLSRACCRLQSFLPSCLLQTLRPIAFRACSRLRSLPSPPQPSTDRLQSLLSFSKASHCLQSVPLPPELAASRAWHRLQSFPLPPELPAASRASRHLQSLLPPLLTTATRRRHRAATRPTDQPIRPTYKARGEPKLDLL